MGEHQQLDHQAANTLYQKGLTQAQTVIEQSVQEATLTRRQTVGAELSDWLLKLPDPYPRDLLKVRPEELLCFLETHWVHTHVGSQLPGSDTLVASPSGVDGVISHLSSLFDSLGRSGPYDDTTNGGNPCLSTPIQKYRRGYHQMLWAAGYQESSAVPLTQAKVEALVTKLDLAARQSADHLTMLVQMRNALVILHAWTTAYRGTESGKLCLLDLHTTERVPIFPNGYDPDIPLPKTITGLPSHGTKTCKRSRCHQEPVQYHLLDKPEFCFLRHLWAYMQLCHFTVIMYGVI